MHAELAGGIPRDPVEYLPTRVGTSKRHTGMTRHVLENDRVTS